MSADIRIFVCICAAVCGGIWGCCAGAAEGDASSSAVAPSASESIPLDSVAISEARLDDMRGGFDLPSGLHVSFGISRIAFVNGNPVATMNIVIPDVTNMTTQQAQTLANVNAGAWIQNGPGNVIQAGSLPSLTGAVVQNSLNNQQIQALTTINTTVNSLSAFKTMNVISTLDQALTSAVRGR
jgi:hypothetical protein